MRFLELKVPPPIVAAITAALMWLVSMPVGPVDVPADARLYAALVPAAIGLLLGFSGIASFLWTKTTTDPMHPDRAKALVTAGVYRWTRNPMYLGLLLCLTGWAVYLASWPAFVVLPVFVAYLNAFQIGPEERVLTALFGEAYAKYRRKVRRWL